MRITAITPMKNEGPFMLEWLVYHRLIGFNDFIVFTNDCTDGTEMMAERLDEMGLIRHLPNPSIFNRGKGGHHWAAMRYVNAMQRPRRSDWHANFDIDEFWCIHVGDGTLEALFNAMPEAEVISACQFDFGTNGIDRFDPDKLQMEQFTQSIYRTNRELGVDRRRGLKSLVHRDTPIKAVGNHIPVIEPETEVRHYNGNGVRVPNDLLQTGEKSFTQSTMGLDMVQLNHYALRAADNFFVKVDRGNANHHVERQEMVRHWARYFDKYEHNEVKDTAIQRHIPAVKEGIAELLKDPELGALYKASVAWHLDAADGLREQRNYVHLMKRMNDIREKRTTEAAKAAETQRGVSTATTE